MEALATVGLYRSTIQAAGSLSQPEDYCWEKVTFPKSRRSTRAAYLIEVTHENSIKYAARADLNKTDQDYYLKEVTHENLRFFFIL